MPRVEGGWSLRHGAYNRWYQIGWAGSRAEANWDNIKQKQVPMRMACGHMCQTGATISEWRMTGPDPVSQPLPVGQYTTIRACCRCYWAQDWFGVGLRRVEYRLRNQDGSSIMRPYLLPGGNAYQSSTPGHLTTSVSQGLREDFRAQWLRHQPIPEHECLHIGWHAGLRRATLRENQSWRTSGRGRPRRGCDRAGVTSGPGAISALCSACRVVLPTLEPWLFWLARGWPVDKAKAIAKHEATLWKPGNSKQSVTLDILDAISEFLPWH